MVAASMARPFITANLSPRRPVPVTPGDIDRNALYKRASLVSVGLLPNELLWDSGRANGCVVSLRICSGTADPNAMERNRSGAPCVSAQRPSHPLRGLARMLPPLPAPADH